MVGVPRPRFVRRDAVVAGHVALHARTKAAINPPRKTGGCTNDSRPIEKAIVQVAIATTAMAASHSGFTSLRRHGLHISSVCVMDSNNGKRMSDPPYLLTLETMNNANQTRAPAAMTRRAARSEASGKRLHRQNSGTPNSKSG